nr:putative reverse transcriptase domain-containing protein [Tanacetum cinerariifolium]
LTDLDHRRHDEFHVSNLKKCLTDETLVVPKEEIQFKEESLEIMDREVKRLRHSQISIFKVDTIHDEDQSHMRA